MVSSVSFPLRSHSVGWRALTVSENTGEQGHGAEEYPTILIRDFFFRQKEWLGRVAVDTGFTKLWNEWEEAGWIYSFVKGTIKKQEDSFDGQIVLTTAGTLAQGPKYTSAT